MPSRPPLPPRVRQLGWISLFADVSSEMAYPVLPLFLKNVLHAPLAAIGLVEGIAEGLVSIMKGWSGWRSDQTGRRVPFVQWGYGLSALGKPMIALAYVWPIVLFARVVDRLGKGLRTTARDALIADSVERSRFGEAFGFHRAMDTTGALLGVLIAAGLLAVLPDRYRLVFLLAGIPGAISLVLALRLKETDKGTLESAAPSEPSASETQVQAESEPRPKIQFSKAYWRAVGLTLLFGLGNSSDTFLLLRAQDLGLSAAVAILAYALYNVTYALVSRPAGALSDRIGRWRVIGAGWLLYAAVYAGFASMSSAAVWPLFALYGVYMGLTQGVGKALVAQHAPDDRRGTALGVFYLCAGGVTMLSSIVAGLLWDNVGPSAPFLFGAACAVLAVLGIPLTRRWA